MKTFRNWLGASGLACAAAIMFGTVSSVGATEIAIRPLEARSASSQELRIVAFGSSSTEGKGASRAAATYPAQLKMILAQMMPKGHGVEVLNRGIGGEDADDMSKRLQPDVIERHPDIVIWQTGSNDPIRRVPLGRFERETRDGIAAMRTAGIGVILMEPQWCPRLERVKTTTAYRDTLRKIATDMGLDIIKRSDLMHHWAREGMLTTTQMTSTDGLHMTDAGYALLARSIAPRVLKLAAGLDRPRAQQAAVAR